MTRVRRLGKVACPLFLLLTTSAAFAASRGLYGGTLRVALAGDVSATDPLIADPPAEAWVLGLSTRPICRLDADGRHRPVLGTFGPGALTVRPSLRAADGAALTAEHVAQSWARASRPDARSPYRALLFPLKGEGRSLSASSLYTLPLSLAFPWPDFERSLCHPALSVLPGERTPLKPGAGPYLPTRALGVYVANPAFPEGRPYVDRLSVTGGDPRAGLRLLSFNQAEVGVGVDAPEGFPALPSSPALYATYLAFNPSRTGAGLRAEVERRVDRADLTRFFVRAPAVAMSSMLPPALMPQAPAPRGQPTSAPSRELTLLYDGALEDQRAVAERIQVKLHDAGYRVSLRGVSRTALRSKWASGDFDLMLHALLLPPIPGPALAVVLDAAGRHDLLRRELPPIGAIAETDARDARVRERATALAPELPFIPLYAQGLRVFAAPHVTGLTVDAFGLPSVDSAFLSRP